MNRNFKNLFLIVSCGFFLFSNIFALPQGAQRTWSAVEPGNLGNVNLFNGNLSMGLPLLNIGGRGDTEVPLTLRLGKNWRKFYYTWAQQPGTAERYTTNCIVVYLDGFPHGTMCTEEANRPLPNLVQFYRKIIPSNFDSLDIGYNPGLLYGNSIVTDSQSCNYQPTNNQVGYRSTATRFYLTFVSPDGSTHELVDQNTLGKFRKNTSGTCGETSADSQFSRGHNFISTDGSAMTFVSDNEFTTYDAGGPGENGNDNFTTVSGNLYLANGSQYRIVNGSIIWIKDKNGNKTTFTYYTLDPNVEIHERIHTITDSLGRTVTLEYNVQDVEPYGLCDRITYKGFEGQDKTLRISKTNLSNTLRSGYTIRGARDMWHVTDQSTFAENPMVNPVVASTLWLPDGKSYKFQYNSFVEVARVESPTGSAVEYDHDYALGTAGGSVAYDEFPLARKVTEQRVYTDNNSQTSLYAKTKYSRAFSQNNTVVTVDQTDANDNLSSRTKSSYYGTPKYLEGNAPAPFTPPYGMLNWKEGRQFETSVFASDGTTLLRRQLSESENKTVPWLSNQDLAPSYDTRPTKQVSITIENGKALAVMTKTEYDENGNSDPAYFSHLNVKRTKAYNYKVIEDLNSAKTGDLPTIAALFSENDLVALSEADYLYDAGYKARNILGLPSEIRTLNPSNPTDILAKSQTSYDEQSQYYSMADFGTTTGYEALTGNYAYLRGNATSLRTWNKDANTWIEVHRQFDNFGNLRRVWDLSGDTTRFFETEYSAEYYFAYPTKTVTPAPDPTGTHGTSEGSIATTTYDRHTGRPLTVTDGNGQVTTMEYDANSRLIRVIPPAGGGISETEYGDTPGNLFLKSRSKIDDLNWAESITFLDSFGRPHKNQTKDTHGDVFTETKYDNFGRVQWSSNPYREGDVKYWSRPRYDELGRVFETCAPVADSQQNPLDFSANAACPSGTSSGVTSFAISTVSGFVGTVITRTDASLRKSRSIKNALGQLLRVDEATATGGTADADLGSLASPNQPTFYQYDERGNLKQVNQGGQTRTFTYDSFSRIKSATNPESGTVNYTYDNIGNLKTKRDARGIKTIYDYDRLNRIIRRCYRVIGASALGATDCGAAASETVDPNTSDVGYFYDGKGLAQQQTPNYAKGKLTKVSNAISETLYTEFDSLGRVLTHQQITDGQTYQTSYKFNLSGALAEETYPSGKTVRNFYDTDGDLSRVVKNGKTFASDFSYTRFGAIEKMRLGNGNWESAVFNERLQPVQLGLGNAANNATNLWQVNYQYGELQADGTTVETGKNNGNIAKQTITVPTAGTTQGFTATQTYAYDSLNRLKQAKETIAGQTTWQQTFDYDRYGNRSFVESLTTTLPKGCLVNGVPSVCTNDHKSLNPIPNQTDNRLKIEDGYEYDANGNLTKDADGRRFTYDALNKQTQVKDAANQPLGIYFYDGEGRRIKKTSNAENTLFVYDVFDSLIAEYTLDNAPPNPTPNVSYQTTDILGSPRIITGKNGEVLSRRDFLPFGEEISVSETNRKAALGYNYGSQTRQAFTGYEKDTETEFEFAQNRYYSNKHGRFTSADPLMASGKSGRPQTWNRYVYVRNNPLNLTDPMGLCPPEEEPCWTDKAGHEIPGHYVDGEYRYCFNGPCTEDKGFVERVIDKTANGLEKAWEGTKRGFSKAWEGFKRGVNPGNWGTPIPKPPPTLDPWLDPGPGPGPIERVPPDGNAPDPSDGSDTGSGGSSAGGEVAGAVVAALIALAQKKIDELINGKPLEEGFIYRLGSKSPGNLAPRPVDINGLSATMEEPGANQAYVKLDVSKLRAAGLLVVNDAGKHVAIFPRSGDKLVDWMIARATGAGLANKNTKGVNDAIVKVNKGRR